MNFLASLPTKRLDPNKPAYTVTGSGGGGTHMYHWKENRALTNKLDSNYPSVYTSWQKSYNTKNFYSNFNLLNNSIPTKQFVANVVPDYVTLTYDCIVQTYYVEQLNKIVEAINYASDSYWGNPSRFKFRARIDSFNIATQLDQGKDRSVRSEFSIKMYGYIIPDVVQKETTAVKKYNAKSKIIFFMLNIQNIISSNWLQALL